MKIARQLSVSYMLVFSALIGLFILFVGFFVYQELLRAQMSNTEALVVNMKRMIENSVNGSIKSYLRGIAEKDVEIVAYFYGEYKKGNLGKESAMKAAGDALLSQRIGKTGYVYCIDSLGTVRVHPNAGLRGTDLSKYDFILTQRTYKSGYIEYDWANPGESKARPKSLYMAYFEPWDWIISVTAYRNEFIDMVAVKDFEGAIHDIKIGKSDRKSTRLNSSHHG
jgi:signal transduction histidine kinase